LVDSNFELWQVPVIAQRLHGDVAARPAIQTREKRAFALIFPFQSACAPDLAIGSGNIIR
jgi:hypothetical protein